MSMNVAHKRISHYSNLDYIDIVNVYRMKAMPQKSYITNAWFHQFNPIDVIRCEIS